MKKKVLVVAAHPDDEVLGCGGTMARLASEGCEVHVAILGEGETSRFQDDVSENTERVEKLNAASQKAAAILKVEKPLTFGLPDNKFDSVPLLEIIKIVEGLVSSLKPEVLFTHHSSDLNIDHQVTNRAVLTATRPIRGMPVKELYAFEVASSTEWNFQSSHASFRANYFVDISKYMDRKLKAMAEYETEMRPFPHPRSSEALRTIGMRWGSVVGCECAEAFEVIRSIC
jgi:LmbE family N-acetylglucosaminyl deacetylase